MGRPFRVVGTRVVLDVSLYPAGIIKQDGANTTFSVEAVVIEGVKTEAEDDREDVEEVTAEPTELKGVLEEVLAVIFVLALVLVLAEVLVVVRVLAKPGVVTEVDDDNLGAEATLYTQASLIFAFGLMLMFEAAWLPLPCS